MKLTRILATVVIVALALRRLIQGRAVGEPADTAEVRYRVPLGQDPAAIVAALRVAGLRTRSEAVNGNPVLAISTSTTGGRERIREILRGAPLNVEGDSHVSDAVTFSDEV